MKKKEDSKSIIILILILFDAIVLCSIKSKYGGEVPFGTAILITIVIIGIIVVLRWEVIRSKISKKNVKRFNN